MCVGIGVCMGSVLVSIQYRHLGLFLKLLQYSEYSDYIFGTLRIFFFKKTENNNQTVPNGIELLRVGFEVQCPNHSASEIIASESNSEFYYILCLSQTHFQPLPVQTQGMQLLKLFIQIY